MCSRAKRPRKNLDSDEDNVDSTDTKDSDFGSISEDEFSRSSSLMVDYELLSDKENLSPGKEIGRDTAASSKNQNQLASSPHIDFMSTTFRPILEESDAYVDKTMFIKSAFEGPRAKLALAPRRFMKSVNMNTLKTFLWIVVDEKGNVHHNTKQEDGVFIEKPVSELTENYKLFKNYNLQIYQCHCGVKHSSDFSHCKNKQFFYEHCGEHPVVYADFKGIGGNNMWDVIFQFRRALKESYLEHAYLLTCDGLWLSDECVYEKNKFSKRVFSEYCMDRDVVTCTSSEEKQQQAWKTRILDGFVLLTKILQTWFKKKTFVLIDEYDHPILKAMLVDDAQEYFIKELVNFIQELMSAIVKNNDANVSHVLLNACVQLAQVLSGEGNNVEPYPFLQDHKLSEFYGLTEQEITYLLRKPPFQKYQNQLEMIKEWYNKYQVAGKPGTAIYSNWSVLHYLEYGTFKSYWVKSGYIQGLKEGFANKDIQEMMEKLFTGTHLMINSMEKLQIDHILKLRNLLKGTEPYLSFEEQCLFLQYISNHGYLNIICVNECKIIGPIQEGVQELKLKIPNLEIMIELGREFYSTELFMHKYCITIDAVNAYKHSINFLDDCNETTFIDLANSVHKLFSNYKQPVRHEFELHGPLFTFLKQDLRFANVFGEPPALLRRRYRADIVILRHDGVGIILEIKRLGSAAKGLEQIVSKEYYRTFEVVKTKIQKCILASIRIQSKRPYRVSVCYIPNFDMKKELPEVACNRRKTVKSAS